MRRTAREPARYWGILGVFWLLTGWFALDAHSPAERITLGLALLLTLAFTAYTLVTRATMDREGLALHALRRRHRLRARIEKVVGYHMDGAGAWWVHTRSEGTSCHDPAVRTRVAVREPWALHRAFVELAPRKLGGKRMRFPGVPPDEEFRGLWVYDMEDLSRRAKPTIAGVLCGAVLVALLHPAHAGNGGGAIGLLAGLLIAPAVEGWARIDVTREGIVWRAPFRRREIRWGEAKAIFREGTRTKRSFVIAGPDAAIHLPAHLAIDRDLIEKVLYSLPDPILCVNFDETTLCGYRRRKKAKERTPARSEDLLPALTA